MIGNRLKQIWAAGRPALNGWLGNGFTAEARHGVGHDSLDLAALGRHRIPLAIAGDVKSVSVSERAMRLPLAAAKRAVRADHAVRSRHGDGRNRPARGVLSGKRRLVDGAAIDAD